MYYMFVFPIVFVYFEVLLRVFNGISVFEHLFYPVVFGIGAGCMVSFLTSLCSQKINRIISAVILAAVGILYIVECLIFRSFQFYVPLDTISSMTSDVTGNYMDTIFQTILTGLPVILLFIAPALLYLIFWKKTAKAEVSCKWKKWLLFGMSVYFTLIGVLEATTGTLAEKYTSQYQFNYAVQYFGLTSSLELDMIYRIFGKQDADALLITTDEFAEKEDLEDELIEEADTEETTITDDSSAAAEEPEAPEEIVYEKNEMDLKLDEISAGTTDEVLISMNEYVKSTPASSQNEYTGLFKGKNLIMICAEAFSHAAVSEELTPTLYRLTHNGFYFSNYYQPSWNGSTSTGEYSMLMGIAPLMDVRTMPATEGHNLYFTMGNQLHRLGYTGDAFHNGGYEYYSRHLTHENLGYDKYVALGSGMEDLSRWWPTDSEMFEGTIPTYIDEQPFSVYYMTGTGHFPYTADNLVTLEYIDHVREVFGDTYKDKTLYYLCYQLELEKSLTILVEQLEAKGIADDTVICITSDHYPYGLEHSSTYGNKEDYIEDLYGYYPENDWERDQNGWILWSGCLENEYKDLACEISEPTYSLDILPTLSNLFGLEYDSRLLVGRDVFSDAAPLALWVNYSWVTDKGKYDANTDTFYPNEGVAVSERYVRLMKQNVANKLSFSGKILDYDYYNLLLGEER